MCVCGGGGGGEHLGERNGNRTRPQSKERDHTPSIAFRQLSEYRFPAPFLKTLPDLVTPLKGHSLSPRSCPPTRSALSERFGYWYTTPFQVSESDARSVGVLIRL